MIVIGGATATGKTKIAARVAKLLNGELISADSMQIYRGMDIGTAKERDEDLGIKQHLIDIVEPDASFSVVDFRMHAERAIAKIKAEGKVPIVVGGTGFYISSLLYPFQYGDGQGCVGNEEIRAYWQKIAGSRGNQVVWAALNEKDSMAAQKIHPNNLKRVIRALEVIELTGVPFSAQNTRREIRDDVDIFCIETEREVLAERIRKRINKMIWLGLENEVRELNMRYSFSLQSMQGIGYKEWKRYFENSCTLEDVCDAIFFNTKHYAKRQETWFRGQYGSDVKILNNTESTVDEIIKYYEKRNNL